MIESPGIAAVRAFVDAFNAEDVEALAATLTQDAEIQSSRGVVQGREEAKAWATRKLSGELHQRLVLDDVEERGAHAIATVRRQWYWREDRDVADEHRFWVVATLRDGLIARWQPCEEHEAALRAAGVEA